MNYFHDDQRVGNRSPGAGRLMICFVRFDFSTFKPASSLTATDLFSHPLLLILILKRSFSSDFHFSFLLFCSDVLHSIFPFPRITFLLQFFVSLTSLHFLTIWYFYSKNISLSSSMIACGEVAFFYYLLRFLSRSQNFFQNFSYCPFPGSMSSRSSCKGEHERNGITSISWSFCDETTLISVQ